MGLPSDQELAKLRIYLNRAQRELAAIERENAPIIEKLRSEISMAELKVNDCAQRVYERAKELGYCDRCGARFGECLCPIAVSI